MSTKWTEEQRQELIDGLNSLKEDAKLLSVEAEEKFLNLSEEQQQEFLRLLDEMSKGITKFAKDLGLPTTAEELEIFKQKNAENSS